MRIIATAAALVLLFRPAVAAPNDRAGGDVRFALGARTYAVPRAFLDVMKMEAIGANVLPDLDVDVRALYLAIPDTVVRETIPDYVTRPGWVDPYLDVTIYVVPAERQRERMETRYKAVLGGAEHVDLFTIIRRPALGYYELYAKQSFPVSFDIMAVLPSPRASAEEYWGALVASCIRLHWEVIDDRAQCDRAIFVGDLQVTYELVQENIALTPDLDAMLAGLLQAWDAATPD